jgi:hypothetical protein
MYTLPSFVVQPCYIYALPLHALSRTVFSLCTRSHECLSLSVQKDNFTPHTAFLLGSFQHSELRTNVLCFRKVLVSREGAQLQLNTTNTRTVRNISPLHQSYPATLFGILIKVNSCINFEMHVTFTLYLRSI